MTQHPDFIAFPLEDKTVLWLAQTNRYVLTIPEVADIAGKILEKQSDREQIIAYCSSITGLSNEDAKKSVAHIEEFISQHNCPEEKTTEVEPTDEKYTSPLNFSVYYEITGQTFRIDMSDERVVALIHPKFSHLETQPVQSPNYHFRLILENDIYSLIDGGQLIGRWPLASEHFFAGMFSLKLTEKLYQQSSEKWMGVFHASGISDGNTCMLLAGDSGAGKSTASVLLVAEGFDLIADDFLPVESETGKACRFPGAISVKKTAVTHLSSLYPQLSEATQYHFHKTGKTVRYIPPVNPGNLDKTPCKLLVFIRYSPNSPMRLKKLSQEKAISKLIPDSWIQPSAENASRFLNWFAQLECYQLTYSDNKQMTECIRKLFQNVR